MSNTRRYPELQNALNAFRDLFMQNKIPVRNIQPFRNFLREVAKKEEWTVGDAVRVYKIVEKYADSLKRHGFDWTSVPRVQVMNPQINNSQFRQLDRQLSRFIRYDGSVFQIFFAYDKNLVAAVKRMNGAKWHQESLMWTVPFSQVEKVKAFTDEHKFQISESAYALLTNIDKNLDASYNAERVELDIPLKMELFDFQTGGADYMIKNERVINGDVMGLGKTCQAIAAITGIETIKEKESFPCLVVCPKPLRKNWRKEWQMWTDKKVMIIDKKNARLFDRYIELGLADVVITNFEGVNTFFIDKITEYEQKVKKQNGEEMMVKAKRVTCNDRASVFKSMIIDEAHILRNPKTISHKCAKAVSKFTNFRMLLTGTPIVTSPRDLGSLLDIAGRVDQFGGMHRFLKDYRRMKKSGLNEDQDQSDDLRALNIKLRSTCFIRREKHQVLKDLPDKMRHIVSVEIDNRKEYDTAVFSLQEYLAQKGYTSEQISRALNAELLVQIGHLKQIAARGKLTAVKNFIEECMNSGEQVGVFCWHKSTAKFIHENFDDVVMITGDQDDDEIERNKVDFQSGKARIIVCTYKKASTGHTLTAASKMLSIELPWTYADMVQAEDRFHRIGQINDVDCYYFLGEETFDEDVYEILIRRMEMEKAATDGREVIETNQWKGIADKLFGSAKPSESNEQPTKPVEKNEPRQQFLEI